MPGLAYLLISASLLAGATSEPWKKADPTQWTSGDVNLILGDSPWSQEAGASFALAAEDAPPPPAIDVPQAGMQNPHNAATDGRWDGGVGRVNRNRPPTLNVTVRWESALPVRLAVDRSGGNHSYTPEQLAKDYIITVLGLVPAGHYGKPKLEGRSGDGLDARNPEEMLENVMRYSRLEPRGRKPILPEDAKIDNTTGALQLFFPRKADIGAHDKEVTFHTRFGSLSVAATFRLKKMVYRGQLEL